MGLTKILDDFCKFVSILWFINIMVVVISSNLEEAGEPGTSKGEMFTYTECKLLMATVIGFSQHQFFSATKFNEETNP